jgi:hypothetical protein
VTARLAPAALAALALAASAAPVAARAESPVHGSVELQLGSYRPDIDGEFSATNRPGPYEDAFGGKRPLMWHLLLSKALWRGAGTFEAGVGVGFFRQSGRGIFAAGAQLGQPSGDKTTFNIVPTSLALTWRFDLLLDRWNVPIVPFARASLERYNWWVTDGTGSTVKSGATNGYSYGGGLGLALDFFDPMLGRELDSETGVNHAMLVLELKKTAVDDFGSGSSWNLSDTNAMTLSFGLGFVF